MLRSVALIIKFFKHFFPHTVESLHNISIYFGPVMSVCVISVTVGLVVQLFLLCNAATMFFHHCPIGFTVISHIVQTFC